jgi:hypothetical protein
MNTKEKAKEIFNWVASTQFNIVYDSDGNLIPRNQLVEQIRYRAKTYIRFCCCNIKEIPNIIYWHKVEDEIDNCF